MFCQVEARRLSRSNLGLSGDIPVPGSYATPNGPMDFAVWRPSDGNWYVLSNDGTTVTTTPFGLAGDVAVPGDYDGDGIADFAVWAPSEGNLYIQPSTTRSPKHSTGELVDECFCHEL